MRALLQRVREARVRVDGRVVGEIGTGILAFVACCRGDSAAEADALARRIAGYRVFEDPEGRTNLDLSQVGGEVLVISQFTLAADTRTGRRPSFTPALAPAAARPLVERVATRLREAGIRVAEGEFGAAMEVELVNLGPATYLLEVPGLASRT